MEKIEIRKTGITKPDADDFPAEGAEKPVSEWMIDGNTLILLIWMI